MKQPLVSIIIVNWNGKDLLFDCLKSLTKISYPNFEVIVVDNGSTDGSVEMIGKLRISNYELRIIKNKNNLGFAEANNIGVKEANGEYVLLLNNDTEVKSDFLEKLVKTMEEDYKVAVVQPKIIFSLYNKLQAGGSFFTLSGFLNPIGFFKDPNDPKYNQAMKIFSANGACMLIRKSIIDKVKGLFDPDYFAYYEETDFCWRVILSGNEILYEPSSVILHKGRQTSIKLISGLTQYLSFRNRICSLIKNLSLPYLLIILPIHVFFSFIWMAGFLGMGKHSSFFSIPKAYWWNFANIGNTLKKRKIVQNQIRQISDKQWMKKYTRNRKIEDYLLFFYKIDKYKG